MKFIYAITAITLIASNAFGATQPSKKSLKSITGSAIDSITTGASDVSADTPQSSPTRRGRSSSNAVAGAAAEAVDMSDSDIMRKYYYFTPQQTKFCEQYRGSNNEVVKLVLNQYNEVLAFTKKIEKGESFSPEEIDDSFEAFAEKLRKFYPDGMLNLGQMLTDKKYGLLLCFAIDECIGYNGTAKYDQMDLDEVCPMFAIRHTFYSHMLDGGTDNTLFTTDVAAKVWVEKFDTYDGITVCCKGTTTNPEGNKWRTMEKQCETFSTKYGLADKDRMTFWWMLSNLNVAHRALRCYAKHGEGYTVMCSSRRNTLIGYGNDTGEVLEDSPILKIYNTCHPQSAMTYLPQRKAHPVERVHKYAIQMSEFVSFLNDEKVTLDNGDVLVLKAPNAQKPSNYYRRKAKLPEYRDPPASAEEIEAEYITLLAVYVAPRLGKLFAKSTSDHRLDNFDETAMQQHSQQLTVEDKKNYNTLLDRMGPEKLVKKIKRRRGTQLLYPDLVHLSIVVSNHCVLNDLEMDMDTLSSFDYSLLSEEEDCESAKKLGTIYGSHKLAEKLLKVHQDWLSSSFVEDVDLRNLAHEIATHQDANTITTLNESMFKDQIVLHKYKTLVRRYNEEVVLEKVIPYLLRYQGECPGITATGNLPPHYCGKQLTVENPLQTIGRSSNKGSGFSGHKVCSYCLEDICYRKYIYHERNMLRQKESNGSLSDEESTQLKAIQSPYKAIHIHKLNGCFCTFDEVVMETNQLDNISLDKCKVSGAPMITQDCGGLLAQQRILAINGICAKSKTVAAVKDLLSEQSENAETVFYVGYLLVKYVKNDEINGLFAYQMRDKIEAAPRPLGINVQMCPTTSLPKISTARKEEKYSLRDKVEIEDYVLSINEEDVTDMEIGDIRNLLKEEGDKTLEILTPNYLSKLP